jgi:hypothetical protein
MIEVLLALAWFVIEFFGSISMHQKEKKHAAAMKVQADKAWRDLGLKYGVFRLIDVSSSSQLIHSNQLGYAFWRMSWQLGVDQTITGKSILNPVSVARAKMILKIRNKQKYKEEFGVKT